VSTRGATTVGNLAVGPARYFQTWSDLRPLGNYADVRSSTASIDGSTTYYRLRLKDWPLTGYPCVLGATELNGGCSTLEAELDRFFRARQASGLCRASDFVVGNPPAAPWQPTSRRLAIFPITQPDNSLQLGVRRDFLQASTSPTYYLRVQWASCGTASTADAGNAKAVPANAEIIPIDVVNTALCPSGLSPENGATDPCSGQTKLGLYQPSFTQYDTEFCEGNPCFPGTGNKALSHSDFEYGAIRFERHYNTLRQLRTFAGMGENWTHGFSARLLTSHFITNDHDSGSAANPDGSYVLLQTERATLEPFRRVSSGLFRSDNKVGQILRYQAAGPGTPATWTVTNVDGTRDVFDVDGLPMQHVDPADPTRSLTFTHVGDLLASVVDGTGRGIRFFYDTGSPLTAKLLSVQEGTSSTPDLALALVRFSYDAEGRLTRVTYRNNTYWQYRYNEPAYAPQASSLTKHLTSVVAPSGQTWAIYRYDDWGRVIDSSHGTVGANRVTLQYGDGQNTATVDSRTYVLGPLGNLRQYYFGALNVQGAPTGTAQTYRAPSDLIDDDGGVTRIFNYEATCESPNVADDRLCKRKDKRGFWTRYRYSDFRPTSVTEAQGTPEQRETVTAWDNTINKMTERKVCAPDCSATTNVQSITRYAYTNAKLVARCEIDPNDPSALAYACSASSPPASSARVRRWTYAYCATEPDCRPGLLRQINGPRAPTDPGMGGLDDVVTHAYRTSDDATCSQANGACAWRAGDRWKTTNALGHVTEITRYDRAGRVTQTKDPNGTLTDLGYHTRGWLAARTVRAAGDGTTTANDATTLIAHDATGNVIKVTQPDGDFLRYWYDDADRLKEVSDSEIPGAGNRIVYTLDAAGNRIREQSFDAGGSLKRQLARQYNALSQLRSLVHWPHAAAADLDGAGVKKTTFTYDPNGNQDLATDPLSTVTDNDHDPLNRLIRTIGDTGAAASDINAATRYSYDARDNLRSVVDPKILTTSYTYDGLNNLTQLVSPDTDTTTYSYDAAGNRLSQTDARNVTASYSYDALSRLAGITYPDATLNVTFSYDQANSLTGCPSSQSLGRLTRITDATGTTSFCYDRRGNVTRKIQVTAATTLTIDTTYTRSDRVDTITYPGGGRARYGRDAQGRLDRIWWRPAGSTTETSIVTAAAYLPFGPLQELTFGNGRTLAKTYDQNYWIDAVNGTPSGLSLDFGTDDVGNIVGLAVGAAANDRVYDYDDLNRLTSVVSGTAANVETFSYDRTGNRLSKRQGAATAVPYAYPTTSHRLQSVGGAQRSYDGAGNTVSRTATYLPRFTYDARNRLSTVVDATCASLNPYYCDPPPACNPDKGPCSPVEIYLVEGIAAQYAYNGRGERVRKVAGSSTALFIYDEAGRLLGEYDAGGVARQVFVWMDDMPVAVVDVGALRYIETDHLSTPRALIDPARNVPVWRWDMQGSAFGEHAANQDPDGDGVAVNFNLRFPGQYLDAETGLHYNYFRDYEPGTGRYVESDPIGLRGGISTFSYATSRPMNAIDPHGLDSAMFYTDPQYRMTMPTLTNCRCVPMFEVPAALWKDDYRRFVTGFAYDLTGRNRSEETFPPALGVYLKCCCDTGPTCKSDPQPRSPTIFADPNAAYSLGFGKLFATEIGANGETGCLIVGPTVSTSPISVSAPLH
jgi:RHS repeat-associated protein